MKPKKTKKKQRPLKTFVVTIRRVDFMKALVQAKSREEAIEKYDALVEDGDDALNWEFADGGGTEVLSWEETEDYVPASVIFQEEPLTKVRASLAAIEQQKAVIAVERDKLRDLYESLEEIFVSVDRGCDAVDEGLRSIRSGLDSMSEQL